LRDWQKGGRIHNTTAVSFESHEPADASPSDHLADLLTRIEPLRDRLERQIASGNTVRIKLAVFAETDNPTFALPQDILRRLGHFGLDLELDIYAI
jgi:hypothetical protein